MNRPEWAPRTSRLYFPLVSTPPTVACLLSRSNLGFVQSMLLPLALGLPASARTAVDALFRQGAILFVCAEADAPYLVGDLRWPGDSAVSVFIAFGDGPRDVRHFVLDDLVLEPDGGVSFRCTERICARLQAIERARVDDPDDYRIAWQLWQQVAPLRQTLIDRSYAEAAC